MVRIRDTLSLGTLEVSAALAAEVAAHSAFELLGEAASMKFGADCNLSLLDLD